MDQHLETFYCADVDMNGIQSHVSLWLTARTFTGALINGLFQQTLLGLCVCVSECVHLSLCVCLYAMGILIRTKCARNPPEREKHQ